MKRQKELQAYRQLVDIDATELITANRKEELQPEETVIAEENKTNGKGKKKEKQKKEAKGRKGKLLIIAMVVILAVFSVLLGWRLVILWEDNRELQTLLKNEQKASVSGEQAINDTLNSETSAGTPVSSNEAGPVGDSIPDSETAGTEGVQSESGADLSQEDSTEQNRGENYPGAYPLRGSAIILKPFGVGQDEDGNETECQGVDFEADEGTQVMAAGAGEVILTEGDSEKGYTIRIDHGNGYISEYLFVSEPEVQAGDKVEKEEDIALVGSNSQKTGAWHLEFRILQNGEYVDPQSVLEIVG